MGATLKQTNKNTSTSPRNSKSVATVNPVRHVFFSSAFLFLSLLLREPGKRERRVHEGEYTPKELPSGDLLSTVGRLTDTCAPVLQQVDLGGRGRRHAEVASAKRDYGRLHDGNAPCIQLSGDQLSGVERRALRRPFMLFFFLSN